MNQETDPAAITGHLLDYYEKEHNLSAHVRGDISMALYITLKNFKREVIKEDREKRTPIAIDDGWKTMNLYHFKPNGDSKVVISIFAKGEKEAFGYAEKEILRRKSLDPSDPQFIKESDILNWGKDGYRLEAVQITGADN